MNISVNASNSILPYRFLFGHDPKPVFIDKPEELDFLRDSERLHIEAADAVRLAQTKMKLLYDDKTHYTQVWRRMGIP
jgi:hypothetical protein